MKHPRLAAALVAAPACPPSAACTSNSTTGGSDTAASGRRTITVTSTDDGVRPVRRRPHRRATLRLQGEEHRLEGHRVLPATPRTASASSARSRTSARACPATSCVNAPAGNYVTACKPGHDRRRASAATFTVTDSGDERHRQRRRRRAGRRRPTTQYRAYVEDQSEQLLAGDEAVRGGVQGGRRRRGPQRSTRPARVHWERIEPVAESFGDLDPKMDAPRGRPRAGPEVDRLAPDREGPVAAGRGLPRR